MGWSGQCQDTEGGGTHSLEGADPWTGQGVKMPPSSCVGVALEPIVVCTAQKNPTREGLVRTVSGNGRRVRTCWKGTTGTGKAMEETHWGWGQASDLQR